MRTGALLLALAFLGSCGEEGEVLPTQTTFGGERPVELLVPPDYDGESARPLVVVLHGHSVTGILQLAYSRLNNLVDDQGAFVMAGNNYWNATAACCDFYDSGVDDARYIRGLIDEVSGVYKIDPKRVFLWGHSNGGFMSYRMACDHADVIAGIVSLAGATHLEPADCNPSEPVNILQIHGTQDESVLFEGGGIDDAYPGVEATMEQWASNNDCAATRSVDSTRYDLDSSLDGEETRVEHHSDCPPGIAVDLWVIEEGVHIPPLRPNFDDLMWDWMSAHPKP
jgi:polyhydroxybutyrate depolymerase